MNAPKKNSALAAAYQILGQAGCPLHYREITERALESGFWVAKGKTPAATINARLAVDINQKGKTSAFRRAGSGVFELNPSQIGPFSEVGQSVRSENRTLYVQDKAKGTTLSFTEAAAQILSAAGGDPLHYRDITHHAIEHHMLETSGKTPEATMYAQILTECKRRKARGEQPRFVMLGRGMVTLARWQAKGLSFQVEEANRKARKQLLRAIKSISPGDFEDLIGRLLAAIGFEEVEVTGRSKDGGIDVRGTLVVGEVIRTRLAVQVKRWRQNVQAPVIQQVRGSLGAHEQGLVITTSDFSKGAKAEAERADATPVGLMDGEKLVALLVENEIGVRRTDLQLIQLGEEMTERV